MRLYQRRGIWYLQFRGKRVSTRCTDKVAADIWAKSYQRRLVVMEAIRSDSVLARQVEKYLRERNERPGYIYGIRSGAEIKIGFTERDPAARVAQVATYRTGAVELVALRRGSRRDEREVHQQLVTAKIRGEWFGAENLLVRRWVKEHRYNGGPIVEGQARQVAGKWALLRRIGKK
jgi:hypothetical protein